MSKLSRRNRMHRRHRLAVLFALLLAQVGCGRYRENNSDWDRVVRSQGNTAKASVADASHWHRAGAMGGYVTSLAEDRYHAELLIEISGRRLSLYFMGGDETQLATVPAQFLTGYYKPLNCSTSQAVVFMPEPLDGDERGRTSRLVGKLEVESATVETLPAETQTIDVQSEAYLAIPGLVLEEGDQRRYMLRFRIAVPSENPYGQHIAPEAHSGGLTKSPTRSAEQPGESAAGELQVLYTTPGGKYTKSDIAANGNRTAAEAYRAFRPQHDPSPRSGDLVCPITRTKANRNCTWIVDGQKYSFCCPPCIDEFLAMAKERPSEILPAEEYRR